MEESIKISMQCVFCFSKEFDFPTEDYEPQHGELIKCVNCGRLNDYDSLWRIAKRKGEEWAEEQAQSMLDDFSKNLNNLFG